VHVANGTRTDLTDVLDAGHGRTGIGMALMGSTIVVAGQSVNASGLGVPSSWTGSTRASLSVIDASKLGTAQGAAVDGADVHITGYTRNSSGIDVPCVW
jgi:hypothetical protein